MNTLDTKPGAPGGKPDVRINTVSSCYGEGWKGAVPFIRLRGRYLEEAGFEDRTRMKVTVEPGRIVLEALTPDDRKVADIGVPPMLVRMLHKRIQRDQAAQALQERKEAL